LSVERGEKTGSLGEERKGRASGALSRAIGAENRQLDVLVPVYRRRDARPPHPAVFAIDGRPPCGMRKGGEELDPRLARRALGRLAQRHDEVGRALELPRYRPLQCPTGFPAQKSASGLSESVTGGG
jgi:hypothetical protein